MEFAFHHYKHSLNVFGHFLAEKMALGTNGLACGGLEANACDSIIARTSLKVLSNENGGGSRLVSIDPL